MKKISFFICLLLIMLLPTYVKAASASVSINCAPYEVSRNEYSYCKIKGYSEASISRVVISASYSSGIAFKSFTLVSDFTGSNNQGTGYDINTNTIDVFRSILIEDDLITGSFNIGTIAVQANENHNGGNETVTLNNIKFFDIDGNIINADNISSTIRVSPTQSTATGLKTLNISGGTLSPALSDNNYGYLINLDSASRTTFGISAVAYNSSDTITFVNGDTNAVISNPNNITFTTTGGKSEMLIKVNVGSVTYNLTVTKPQPATVSSNELASLTVGGLNVSLSSGIHDYEVSLINVSSYQVNATLKDSSNYQISNLTLPTTMSGETEFAIVVNPKNNNDGLNSVTYIVKVKKSGNNSVSDNINNNNNSNPQTGSVALTMAVVLIISFALSIYLYKKNIEGYN